MLAVDKVDADRVGGGEVGGKMFGRVDRTVLAAGAAEAHLQVGEAALHETLHVRIDEGVDRVEEAAHLPVFLDEIDHRLVESRLVFVLDEGVTLK